MDAHSHPDPTRGGPFQRLGGRTQRTRRRRKGDEEGVPLGVDLDAAVGAERLAQDAASFASASAYALAPRSCRSFVEPSTSVKRKVTVPEGRSGRTDTMMGENRTSVESTTELQTAGSAGVSPSPLAS